MATKSIVTFFCATSLWASSFFAGNLFGSSCYDSQQQPSNLEERVLAITIKEAELHRNASQRTLASNLYKSQNLGEVFYDLSQANKRKDKAARMKNIEKYMLLALETDFIGKMDSLEANTRHRAQAAKLIYGSADLKELLFDTAKEYKRADQFSEVYSQIIAHTLQNLMGFNDYLSQLMKEINRLSLYDVPYKVDQRMASSTEEPRDVERFYNLRGYETTTRSSKASFHAAFNDRRAESMRAYGAFLVEVDADKMSLAHRKAAAIAQGIQLYAFLSDRWDVNAIRKDYDLIRALAPGPTSIKRYFKAEAYDRSVVQTWQPPPGVRVISKSGLEILIEVTHSTQILALDLDYSIVKFKTALPPAGLQK